MTEEQETEDKQYEEWIAHGEKRVFVAKGAHQLYAKTAGWWCTAWLGDLEAVRRRGYEPVA